MGNFIVYDRLKIIFWYVVKFFKLEKSYGVWNIVVGRYIYIWSILYFIFIVIIKILENILYNLL